MKSVYIYLAAVELVAPELVVVVVGVANSTAVFSVFSHFWSAVGVAHSTAVFSHFWLEVYLYKEDISAEPVVAAAAGECVVFPCFVVVAAANLINSVNSETETEDGIKSHNFENT